MLCLDASFLFNVLIDRLHATDTAMWKRWLDEQRPMIAPRLMHYEMVNILHKWRRSGKLDESFVRLAMGVVIALPIQLVDDAMPFDALTLARELDLLASYDAHYVAVASRYRADLCTSDRRLWEKSQSRLDRVHYAPERLPET
jgi:predicted nucleic acid-binding protein